MRTLKSKNNLNRDFLVFSTFVTLIIIALMVWFTGTIYQSHLKEKKHRLEQESRRISYTLTNTFEEMTYIMRFIGRQIGNNGPQDLNYISTLLESIGKDKDIKAVSSATGFDWITPNDKLVATTTNGILKYPIDISMRKYAKRAKKTPGKLHLDPPSFGRISAQWIIPSAVGITKNDQYIGAVSLGLSINEIEEELYRTLNNETIRFIIINQEGESILQSSARNTPLDNNFFNQNEQTLKAITNQPETINNTPIYHKEFIYKHAEPIENTPYTIILGYNQAHYTKQIWEELTPILLALTGIGAVFIGLLYVLNRRTIKPIVTLSRIADKISKGRNFAKLPNKKLFRNAPYESYRLAVELSKISRYINRIKRITAEKNQAQHDNQIKSDLLAHVSHELRTPLNAIINFSDIQKSEIFGPMENKKYLEYSEDIHQSAQHLLELINNVLDLSKAEANKIHLNETDIHLEKLITSCVRTFRERIIRSKLKIHKRIEDNMPALYADELRIKQVFLNLLSNAIRFTNSGGSITIEAFTKDGCINIALTDTGIGISPEDLPIILQRFGQAKHLDSRSRGGTGLGLTLSKTLLELHESSLDIQSEVGKGTTITITFAKARTQPIRTLEQATLVKA